MTKTNNDVKKSNKRDLVEALTEYSQELERQSAVFQEFGNGFSYTSDSMKGVGKVYKIYKDGKHIGTADVEPTSSFEEGGMFMIFANPAEGTYRYVNEEGKATLAVYGARSAPFRNKRARVQIINEQYDESLLETEGRRKPAVFSFLKKNKNGTTSIMKLRFSQASLIDEIGYGRVKILGEKNFAYVGMDGKVLPYRFKNGEDLSRDGEISVTFLDGKKGVIIPNGFVYKIEKGQRVPATEYENILTIEDLQKEENDQN